MSNFIQIIFYNNSSFCSKSENISKSFKKFEIKIVFFFYNLYAELDLLVHFKISQQLNPIFS